MYKFNQCFYLIVLLFTFGACKETNEYRIGAEFADYLQRFENEGLARGRTFNLKSDGLIIEFANLKNNTAGLCHYENPIRIEVDKTYWDEISKTAGADLMKENLLFHELGHGLLGRNHLNTTLENGDWKSIMCGGDKVNNRTWNINYRGIRRNYYLNELFDENTYRPDFFSLKLTTDTSAFVPSLRLDFESETKGRAGFELIDTKNYCTSLEKGRLKFQSKVNQVYLVFVKTAINVQSDFAFELSMEYPASELESQYGLIFGYVPPGSTGNTDPIEYFTINHSQQLFMGNRTWFSYFTQLTESHIDAAGNNHLKVIKVGNILYYFVNNVYRYCSEMVTSDLGQHFGFLVPPNGTIYLDNMIVSVKKDARTLSKMKQNQELEFEFKTIESLNQNLVNEQ